MAISEVSIAELAIGEEPAAAAGGVTASGGVASTVPTVSGSGIVSIAGSGGIDAPVPVLDGSGTVGSAVTGSGGVQSPVPALAGDATVSIDGSGAVDASVPTLSGTGKHGIPGSGGIDATAPTLDGSGVVSIAGSGAIQASVPTLDGTGNVEGGAVTGSGAISATVIRLAGAGSIVGGIHGGDDAGPRWAPRGTRPIRVIYDEKDVREALGEQTKTVKPTKAKKRKLVKNVERKVLAAASLPEAFAPRIEWAVAQEVGTAWRGPSDWEVLSAILNVAAQKAVEEIQRIQAEIEEEDEMILLLAA